MSDSSLVAELQEVIAGGVSQAKIAADLGISTAKLSQWLKGKYAGDNDKMEKDVAGYLARQSSVEVQEVLFYPKGIVETTMTALVRSTAIQAYRDGEISVIYGNAGSGKTSGIRAFAYQNQGTIVVTANVGYTAKVLFQEIADNLDLSAKGSVYDIFTRIKNKLKGVKKTIIIADTEQILRIVQSIPSPKVEPFKIWMAKLGAEKLAQNRGKQPHPNSAECQMPFDFDGKKIKRMRLNARLTILELSQLSGVPDGTISGWENGKRPRVLSLVRKVEAVLRNYRADGTGQAISQVFEEIAVLKNEVKSLKERYSQEKSAPDFFKSLWRWQ